MSGQSFSIHDDFVKRQHLLDKTEIPFCIIRNLRTDFVLRSYQKQAFKRLCYYFDKDRDGILFPKKEKHLAFNMATGSGKTLIMAGLILYLYEKGYRNFLFFSTSRQIIEKTKDNFLNAASSKHLFNSDITIDNKKVFIRETETFGHRDSDDIHIWFTTINGLHSKLQKPGENQLTLDDFKHDKTVIIGDEAHHFNVNTKSRQRQLDLLWDAKNWENSIDQILQAHSGNLFFELSATFEFGNEVVYQKYQDKLIYRYDIREFRNDGFSKEILVLQADVAKQELILQAIIFNQYKQEMALKHGLEIKPVILFKANKSIQQSHDNQALFNEILENLSPEIIGALWPNIEKSDNEKLKQAFRFFGHQNDKYRYLIQALQRNFGRTKQLNANESKTEDQKKLGEIRDQEALLNSLEEEGNQIRVIFAVNKLNEGWDVLNLFDIVRLYDEEVHSTKTKNATKKQTISEAQLIGRGARYFPFAVREEDGEEVTYSELDRFRRKFDAPDDGHELRILEELYYHSVYNSAFIASLHEELVNQGWEDDPNFYESRELKIKPAIQTSDFWRKEWVFANKRVKKCYDRYNLWDRLPYGADKRHFEYKIPSGVISTQTLLNEWDRDRDAVVDTEVADLCLRDIPVSLKQNALLYNSFYDFNNLKQKFSKIETIGDFIANYLDSLAIRYSGDVKDLQLIRQYEQTLISGQEAVANYQAFNSVHKQIFQSLIYLLNDIERKLSHYTTPYQGTPDFRIKDPVRAKFKDKILKIRKGHRRLDDNRQLVENKDWFVYKTLHGTSEEIDFVEEFDQNIYGLLQKKGYSNIYLVRNEEDYTIYDFDNGDGFCPDFLLFATNNQNRDIRCQILIEPKGKHIELMDDWKNNMLKALRLQEKHRQATYCIIGLPFYNSAEANRFVNHLLDALDSQEL